MIAALAAMLAPGRFERHAEAGEGGIFSDDERTHTRVVDGACIFLNRPGFVGGAGCALHLAAIKAGESPIDWKPSVCWQLPIKVDWEAGADDTEVATVRGWTRRDWGVVGRKWRGAVLRVRWPTWANARWSTRWAPSWRRSSAPRSMSSCATG
jgi:hypothetical protein